MMMGNVLSALICAEREGLVLMALSCLRLVTDFLFSFGFIELTWSTVYV